MIAATLKFLGIAGLPLTFFGAFILAISLNRVLNRVRDSLGEIERSINALTQGNTPGASQHLGQIVKFNSAAQDSSRLTNLGIWFVAVGTICQVLGAYGGILFK